MRTGDLFVFSGNDTLKERFKKRQLDSDLPFDEKWLQTTIYHNIELLEATDPTYEKIRIVPLCREFALLSGIRNLYLDILAVSETGRLVLVECKLWKNPQARREVLAQAFEYGSLMQSLSYSDLAAKLKKHIKSGNEDPIAYTLRASGIEFDEALLIDRIATGLKIGDFHIIIAGDGIRTELIDLVNSQTLSGMTANLSLLELAVHENEEGTILLSPAIPYETKTIKRKVLISAEGSPVPIEQDESDVPSYDNNKKTKGRSSNEGQKIENRLFWDKAIKQIKFDHPDQQALEKGSNNNGCATQLPDPLGRLTAFRSNENRIGVFLRISDEKAHQYEIYFRSLLEAMQEEISPDIKMELQDKKSSLDILVEKNDVDIYSPETTECQIKWLGTHLNKFVNFLRPLIKEMPR